MDPFDIEMIELDVEPDHSPRPRRARADTSILAAAMLAVGRIIEPHKAEVEITIDVPSGLESPDWLDLDFGDLPEL